MCKYFVILLILMVSGSLFAHTTPDRAITAYMTSEAPTIDGVEDAQWKDVIAYAVARPDTSTEFWPLTAGNDYAGWFKVTWDTDNLYFFFSVTDDTLYADPNSGDNDKIELFFDADASGGYTQEEFDTEFGGAAGWWFNADHDPSRVYDENCSQWVFEIDKNVNITATQGPGLNWPGMDASFFPTEGIVWDVNECADGLGYTMEIKIPFASLLAVTPAAAGDQLGMNVQINDFDVPGERAFYDWIEDYPNAAWQNPATFGLVTLSELAPGEEYNL
ncbi:MAG: sugar-binding protein, partial [Planctomycetota bacterium]